jgi:hypothetical protein
MRPMLPCQSILNQSFGTSSLRGHSCSLIRSLFPPQLSCHEAAGTQPTHLPSEYHHYYIPGVSRLKVCFIGIIIRCCIIFCNHMSLMQPNSKRHPTLHNTFHPSIIPVYTLIYTTSLPVLVLSIRAPGEPSQLQSLDSFPHVSNLACNTKNTVLEFP